MKRVLLVLTATALYVATAATNLVSNTATITNRVQSIVTYTMSNGVARVQDPSGKLIGTAEERALRVAAEGQTDIASAAADAAGTAMEEWNDFVSTNNIKVVYIDAGFTQDLPALAPNFCGWVAGSFYDRAKGEDHYYIWWNREVDYPPSMCARIVSSSGTNWLDGTWKDWSVTNRIDTATGREWVKPYDSEVEWISGDGSQYVITDFIPSSDTYWDVVYSYDVVTNRSISIFGCRNSDSMRFSFGHTSAMTYNVYYFGETSARQYSGNAPEENIISRLYREDDYGYIQTSDDLKKGSRSLSISGEFAFDVPIAIFGLNRTEDASGSFIGKIYGASFSEYGILLHDYRPVRITNERGEREGAMFDTVTGRILRNESGVGSFGIGNDIVGSAPGFLVPCKELVVQRRNANCVLKTGTVITLGGKDGFDADIHKVNIEVGGTASATTSLQLPLIHAVTKSGTNYVTRAFTNGFFHVENGFIKEPTNE